MKIAPLMKAFQRIPDVAPLLVHTGQHYDEAMKAAFFTQLQIPEPDIDLGVGSGTQAVQTAEIMKRFEPILDAGDRAAVLVVGDVNSTIACALVAAKKNVPVVHVEAGLRSFDRQMPEEINRVLTDQLSALLFTTERGAADNLEREGVPAERVRFVGNVMIDTLLAHRAKAPPAAEVLRAHGLYGVVQGDRERGDYGLVTMHRPSNVDDAEVLGDLLQTLAEVAKRLPLIFPVHPRTKMRLEEAGLLEFATEHLRLLSPLGYLDMLGLMAGAGCVLTDSGGLQEETTALGVPCLTLRENTERPVTVDEGTNEIVGRSRERILGAVDEILAGGGKGGRTPELWDGRAGERIADELVTWLGVGAGR